MTVVADTLVYNIIDEVVNLSGRDFTVSTTVLHEYRSTRGHKHDDQDELYIFCQCDSAVMEVGDKRIDVQPGSCIYVNAGDFHKVQNNSGGDCIFVTIFAGKSNRPKL